MSGIILIIPHKVEVLQHLDDIAHDARVTGAVNTIRKEGERLIVENTDGKEFLRSLTQDARFSPLVKRVVVLGAGGAARAISIELASLIRKSTKAKVDFVQWNRIFSIPSDTDMIINATSIGLYSNKEEKPNIDYKSISENMVVCDVIPNPPNTMFLRDA